MYHIVSLIAGPSVMHTYQHSYLVRYHIILNWLVHVCETVRVDSSTNCNTLNHIKPWTRMSHAKFQNAVMAQLPSSLACSTGTQLLPLWQNPPQYSPVWFLQSPKRAVPNGCSLQEEEGEAIPMKVGMSLVAVMAHAHNGWYPWGLSAFSRHIHCT
jgi:hypothetical protein